MNIIIPSAKIVPEELQNLGKLPAVIYPVNQRIVFDYLREEYPDGEFTVVCYENADKVCKKLSRYDKTKVITLDKLEDLGFSIYEGIKNMEGKGIINFADTIVMDGIVGKYQDAAYYAEEEKSCVWTFFNEKDGVIKSIFDKKEQQDRKKGKLFVGVFKISHMEYLALCLEEAFQQPSIEMGSFYYALKRYSSKYPLSFIEAENWFDIGHADKYYNSQIEVKARAFNHIKIDRNRGILTKKSDDTEKFIGEIIWYIKLPTDIEYVRPRIFEYSTNYSSPYVSMEYYAYHTLHELFLHGDLARKQWSNIFKQIRFVCEDFKRYTVKSEIIHDALEDMYLSKTIERLNLLRKDSRFAGFFTSDILINHKRYKSLNCIIDFLNDFIPKVLFDINEFCIIHGDLCFSNIMVDNNFSFVKFIDPRGKFGKFDIYGDRRYELAKLMHSIDGKYDYIIKDLFEVSYDLNSCKIEYVINDRERTYDIYELFIETFKDEIVGELKKIELIEALLFLSMIPLHKESFEHQLVMLGTGLEILGRVVSIVMPEC